jgi:prolipoprotein diacylglyceryltransferase
MVALLGIFVLLLRWRSPLRPPGWLFATYILLSASTRILVEAVRTNPPVFLGLTEAQGTGLALAAGAAFWLSWRSHHDLSRRR